MTLSSRRRGTRNHAASKATISLRRHDLDNLRTYLTGLVIVHHTAVTYGAPGRAPFRSAVTRLASPGADIPPTIAAAFNQSFFMGLFFWISGRVSAQSLARIDQDPGRTRWAFIKSKSLRLGLVAVLYTLVVQPASHLVALEEPSLSSISARLVEYFSTMRGIRGPVWYTVNLLIMDAVTALMAPRAETRAMRNEKEENHTAGNYDHQSPPSWYVWLARYGWIGAAALSFLARLYYPLGARLKIIALQPAYASQYILAYAMGHASWKYGTSFMGGVTLGKTSGKDEAAASDEKSDNSSLSVVAATLVSLATLPVVSIPYLFQDAGRNWMAQSITDIRGGWNVAAFLYALWNELSFIIVCPALLTYFAAWHNRPAKSSLFQARYSYGAFLMHTLVNTVSEVVFDRLLWCDDCKCVSLVSHSLWRWLAPSVMTIVVGAVNVYCSFGVAKLLLDMFPTLRRVI
ncbi:hypothetical protein H634G_03649 [Metarhizium anisopliae BRIP 53293]|uniref:Acyltransferase 3 domain-containing protein n=1 Tax=Metarhizium anisopliae BRIP 53293 TaxID=1291518 RepID=A0A0D9P8I4_METAN|nr:hypothetical protein H634G_03649 [Metarhizium anisopliae BRIP 53293]KJK92075.1 hypothetical protein H633G_04020 [Metarhizium anisopliae BRIP 53284]